MCLPLEEERDHTLGSVVRGEGGSQRVGVGPGAGAHAARIPPTPSSHSQQRSVYLEGIGC